MIVPAIKDESEYRRLRAICDVANAYRERVAAGRNYLTAEEAAAPEYAACSNEIRGMVEQWELLNATPERFCAYVGQDGRSVTVWTGLPLGTAAETSSWRAGRYGTPMGAYSCRINGRHFTGRSQGAGMFISLRETAESKRQHMARLAAARLEEESR